MTTTLLSLLALSSQAVFAERTTKGLQVLYEFQETSGNIVHDTSGVGSPLNLSILSPFDVSLDGERIDINNPTRIETNYVDAEHGDKISQASRTSNELTIEAWINAESTDLFGPARIIAHSNNPSSRDFMLAQDGENIVVRLSTSDNGLYGHTVNNATIVPGKTQHLVFTRSNDGQANFYLDGKKVDQWHWKGTLESWEKDRRLVIGNDYDTDDDRLGGRDWLGDIHLIAVYSKSLSSQQIVASFIEGANSEAKSATKLIGNTELSRDEWLSHVNQGRISTVVKTVTIDNTSDVALDITQLKIQGLDIGRYVVLSHTCESELIDVNSSCTFLIKVQL